MSHIDVEEIVDLPHESINPIDMLIISFLIVFVIKLCFSLKS